MHKVGLKRIFIVGASGTGKSTLARMLGARLNLPVIHIDPFFFTAGWVQRPQEETAALISKAIQEPEWVFEGNFSSSFDERAEAADLIVMLEVGRYRRMWRVIWRTLRFYGRTRPDMAPGCPERLSLEFLLWVWSYESERRDAMEELLAKWATRRPILRLTSSREISEFVNNPSGYLYEHQRIT